jgi:hypothetical protein
MVVLLLFDIRQLSDAAFHTTRNGVASSLRRLVRTGEIQAGVSEVPVKCRICEKISGRKQAR